MFDGSTEFLAPSTFCWGQGFEAWMGAVNAGRVIRPSLDVEAYYLRLSKFALPRSVLQMYFYHIEGQQEFSKALKDWAINNPASLCDDDEFLMGELCLLLCFIYRHIKQSTSDRAKEVPQRRGLDDLIGLAFGDRRGCQCKIRTDEPFRLCGIPPSNIPPRSLPKPTSIADTLVTSPLMQPIPQRREPFDIYYQQFWGEKAELSLILFAGEFKRNVPDSNKNQLVMSLLTAQNQRRALGMEGKIILGAIYVMGRFVTYSSWWQPNGMLAIYEHPALSITNPVAFLQCYSFLCRLHDDVKTSQDEVALIDINHRKQSLVMHTWRAPDKPKSRGGSKGSRPGALKKPDRDTIQESEELQDLKMQDEASWQASRKEWRKQSNEDWKRTSSAEPFCILTAERLEHLGGQDLSFKIQKWSRSLDGGVDPTNEIALVEDSFRQETSSLLNNGDE